MRNTIYSVANPGGRLYPVSVCLQMALAYKKDYYQIYELENISGNPYGWFYLNDLKAGDGKDIEISPGTELTNSIRVAYKNLGYEYEHCMTEDWDQMVDFIKREVDNKNIVIYGPMSYQQLTYQIGALRAPAVASHYVVVVGYDQDKIYYHDPNGMSYVPMPFSKLKETSTLEVMMPGTKRFSAISLKERLREPSKLELYKSVLDEAVNGYKSKKVRKNGYIGLEGILHYADDIVEWLGAETKRDKELVLRKLGLYFYPKGNQIRSDAISFMNDLAVNIPDCKGAVDEFCALFMEACIIYKHGAEVLTPRLVTFNENGMESDLKALQEDAHKLYELESKAFSKIKILKDAL